MKKFFCFLFVSVVIFSLAIGSAAHYDNACYGAIDLYKGDIKLDGYMDSAYQKYGKNFTRMYTEK